MAAETTIDVPFFNPPRTEENADAAEKGVKVWGMISET